VNIKTNNTMAKVETVTGFKTSDGQIFDDKVLALSVQSDLDMKKELKEFVENTFTNQSDKEIIFETMLEFRVKLSRILSLECQ
jgi:hypothetical protein